MTARHVANHYGHFTVTVASIVPMGIPPALLFRKVIVAKTPMRKMLELGARISDKVGSIGSMVAAMGCAACFPALGSIAAALGMGFLAQWEGMFINTLLPLFAAIALFANAFSWLSHRQWHRGILGTLGPTFVLLTLYPLWKYGWSTYLLYAGLILMLVVAIWDLRSPPHVKTFR